MQIEPTTLLLVGAAAIISLLLIVVIIAMFVQFRQLGSRLQKSETDQGVVNQGVNLLSTDLRGLVERISTVETNQNQTSQGVSQLATSTIAAITELKTLTFGVTDSANAIRTDLGYAKTGLTELAERISTVEKGQGSVYQGMGNLATNAMSAMSELKTLTSTLADATGAMRTELTRAKDDLTELHSHVKTSQQTEQQIADSIYRLETVIAGTQTKGMAGENILETVFAKLPAAWQERNYRIGGKYVEFALRLPNNLILPIDSKWAATNLLEQFLIAEDLQERQRLKKAIEDAVLAKAREVTKYIEPSITVNFGVAVVPDAVYDLCAGIQPDTFRLNVVLVSYSMFIPYLLLVFQTTLKNNHSIDLQKVDAYLQTAHKSIGDMQAELNGRFSRAITMLNNSRDDMQAALGKLGGSLTGLQMGTGSMAALEEPEAESA